MAENKEHIIQNPKLPSFVLNNNRQKVVDQKKEETNPPEKPDVVTIPASGVVSPPPVKAEFKFPGKFSHPAVLWPLSALGGFLILWWAWKKWRPDDDETKKK
ncbi:hypothetical protein IC582_022772 [Cucumis melo]|uniref:Uncharacterized protein LOC103489415 n=1 Tax=Cucumis melo TaxID=3656 RepID=A0A1S3BGK5_CUCME|nr:uncharacterized protein LOC103489415 [Cucumis melo]